MDRPVPPNMFGTPSPDPERIDPPGGYAQMPPSAPDPVDASDGHIGKIDEASTIVGDSYLVVDTGPWIFGKKVLLPAGTVTNVDHGEKRVYVDRTKGQIKDSPEYDPDTFRDESYRDKIGGYYGGTYPPGTAVPGTAVPPLAADTEGSGPEQPGDYPR